MLDIIGPIVRRYRRNLLAFAAEPWSVRARRYLLIVGVAALTTATLDYFTRQHGVAWVLVMALAQSMGFLAAFLFMERKISKVQAHWRHLDALARLNDSLPGEPLVEQYPASDVHGDHHLSGMARQ